jgi:hypothetical protein
MEGLAMEDVGIFLPFVLFYGNLVYIFCGHWGIIFSSFGKFYQEKSGNPERKRASYLVKLPMQARSQSYDRCIYTTGIYQARLF